MWPWLRGVTSPDLCARFSAWQNMSIMRAQRAADQIAPNEHAYCTIPSLWAHMGCTICSSFSFRGAGQTRTSACPVHVRVGMCCTCPWGALLNLSPTRPSLQQPTGSERKRKAAFGRELQYTTAGKGWKNKPIRRNIDQKFMICKTCCVHYFVQPMWALRLCESTMRGILESNFRILWALLWLTLIRSAPDSVQPLFKLRCPYVAWSPSLCSPSLAFRLK